MNVLHILNIMDASRYVKRNPTKQSQNETAFMKCLNVKLSSQNVRVTNISDRQKSFRIVFIAERVALHANQDDESKHEPKDEDESKKKLDLYLK